MLQLAGTGVAEAGATGKTVPASRHGLPERLIGAGRSAADSFGSSDDRVSICPTTPDRLSAPGCGAPVRSTAPVGLVRPRTEQDLRLASEFPYPRRIGLESREVQCFLGDPFPAAQEVGDLLSELSIMDPVRERWKLLSGYRGLTALMCRGTKQPSVEAFSQ